MTRFLILNLKWLATNPAAIDFATEISELTANAASALDPAPKKPTSLGACPEIGCEAVLHANPAGRTIACDHGHELRIDKWLLLHRKATR